MLLGLVIGLLLGYLLGWVTGVLLEREHRRLDKLAALMGRKEQYKEE